MAPTYSYEEIEGRSYKYAYSPVPVSSSSAVYDSTTLGKHPVDIGAGSTSFRVSNRVRDKCRASEMAEKGSTFLQYVAAAAGKTLPFNPFAFLYTLLLVNHRTATGISRWLTNFLFFFFYFHAINENFDNIKIDSFGNLSKFYNTLEIS